MSRMKALLFFAILQVAALGHTFPYIQRHQRTLSLDTAGVGWEQDTIQQLLDHFDPDNNSTFSQRYYVVPDYWDTPNGPIILSVAGEAPQDSPNGINDEIAVIAQQNKALVLTLEHRFFGQSLPFNDLKTEHLKFLTVEQELEDLAYFFKFYQDQINEKYHKTTRNKMLVIGGSYAGMISSNMRLVHPEIVDVAWSSSGVVDAVFNFSAFDLQVGYSMGQKCATIIRKASVKIEEILQKQDQNSKVKNMFSAAGMNDDDFMWMLSDSETLPLQYGYWSDLCSPLESAYDAGEDIVSAMADVCNNFFYPTFCGPTGPYLYSNAVMMETSITDASSQRAWWWMKCNELSYAQTYPGELGIRSPRITIDWHKKKCDTVFESGIWPPDCTGFNFKYGAKHPDTTNVYYLNASQDPWQWAGVRQSISDSLPAWVMTGTDVGHCRDLHAPSASDPTDVINARADAENFVRNILSS